MKEKKALIEANRQYWEGRTRTFHGDKWIYVYHCLSSNIEYSIHETIVALGLQEKEQMPVTVVTDGRGGELQDELDASFGLKDVYHLLYKKFDHVFFRITSYIAAKYLSAATYGKKDKLFQMRYRGVLCGDAICDEILVREAGKVFDCFEISKKEYFQYVRNAVSTIDKSYSLLKKKRPAYVVTAENFCLKGLFTYAAQKFGASILIISNDTPAVAARAAPDRKMFQDVKTSDMLRRRIESYLEKNPEIKTADSPEELFVVAANRSEKSEDLLQKLGIANKKKNVFILLHAFRDCPRENFRHRFYHDYNEWFLDTLEIIKNIPDVNWIIKDHPFSLRYQQDDYVKKQFMEHKAPNVYWCDRSISGMDIKELADCVITYVGDAALEYWAYGVPTITVSESYFSNWGISYSMKTLEEYRHTLQTIHTLKKPDEASVELAKKTLYALKCMASPEDPLARVFLNARKTQFEGYKQGILYQDIGPFCEEYIRYLKESQVESSEVYQLRSVFDI